MTYPIQAVTFESMIWFSFPVFWKLMLRYSQQKKPVGGCCQQRFSFAFQTSKVLVDPSISMEPEIDEPNLCNFHQPLRQKCRKSLTHDSTYPRISESLDIKSHQCDLPPTSLVPIQFFPHLFRRMETNSSQSPGCMISTWPVVTFNSWPGQRWTNSSIVRPDSSPPSFSAKRWGQRAGLTLPESISLSNNSYQQLSKGS